MIRGQYSACGSIMQHCNITSPRWKNSTLKVSYSTEYHRRNNVWNKQGSHLAKLIKKVSLLLWDEATMSTEWNSQGDKQTHNEPNTRWRGDLPKPGYHVQGNNKQHRNGQHISYWVLQHDEVSRNPRPSSTTEGRFSGDAPTQSTKLQAYYATIREWKFEIKIHWGKNSALGNYMWHCQQSQIMKDWIC